MKDYIYFLNKKWVLRNAFQVSEFNLVSPSTLRSCYNFLFLWEHIQVLSCYSLSTCYLQFNWLVEKSVEIKQRIICFVSPSFVPFILSFFPQNLEWSYIFFYNSNVPSRNTNFFLPIYDLNAKHVSAIYGHLQECPHNYERKLPCEERRLLDCNAV
jgi:hypothetical protein